MDSRKITFLGKQTNLVLDLQANDGKSEFVMQFEYPFIVDAVGVEAKKIVATQLKNFIDALVMYVHEELNLKMKIVEVTKNGIPNAGLAVEWDEE